MAFSSHTVICIMMQMCSYPNTELLLQCSIYCFTSVQRGWGTEWNVTVHILMVWTLRITMYDVAQAVQAAAGPSTVVVACCSLLLCCSQPFGSTALCCQNLQPGHSARSRNAGRAHCGSQCLISHRAALLAHRAAVHKSRWFISGD